MRHDRFLGTHRALVLSLAVAFGSFVAWACLAEVDVVANAQGKLVPATFARISQPVEGGVVRAVHVKDGQQVKAGDALVELDPLGAKDEAQSAESQVDRLKLKLERLEAEMADRPFSPTSGDESLRNAAISEFSLQRTALEASLAEAAAAKDKAIADARSSQARLTRAQQLLPLIAKQAGMQRELLTQGFVSDAAATDKFRELVDIEQEAAAQEHTLRAAQAAVEQADRSVARIRAESKRQAATDRGQALGELQVAQAELAKRGQRVRETTLRAPVAGTVNGLATLSVGQVVSTGTTLLTVVPDGESLRMDGWVRNEDAAYVSPGMPAKVKVAAYPFQKYGWVEGEVAWLGVDSETPESMRNAQGQPLFYRMRVDFKRQELARNGKTYPLRPGMQVVADIQIGRRTLLEYLTSPMRRVLLEAARER